MTIIPKAHTADTDRGGIISAYHFAADGSAQTIEPGQIDKVLAQPGGWTWVHLGLAHHSCRDWIVEHTPLSGAAHNVLIGTDEHLRLDIFGTEITGVLPDLARNLAHSTDDIVRLRFAMTERVLVTARRNPAHAVEVTRRSIEAGQRFPTAISFFDALVDGLIDTIDRMTAALDDELDLIEPRVLHEELGDERDRLGRVRLQAARLHRQLAQLRSLFHRVEPRLAADHKPLALAIGALAQKLDALDHDAAALYERSRLLLDEVAGKMTAVANRRLFTLSILTACLLPPTLVTGFFGMNTKDLPFQNSDGGTWMALLVAAAAGALSYWLLARLRAL